MCHANFSVGVGNPIVEEQLDVRRAVFFNLFAAAEP